MAFVRLFARLQPVEQNRALISLPWEWSPDPALTSERQRHAHSCRPFDHPKASLWGTSVSFSTLPVTDSKTLVAYGMYFGKNGTKVIFCFWGFSSPFSVMTYFDIKARWFLQIQPLCIYLHLTKPCQLVSHPYLLQNETLCTSPGSALKKVRRRESDYSLANMGLSIKAFSSKCHQQQMAPGTLQSPQGCKQPHPHESGFSGQLHPFPASLLNACGCSQPLRKAFWPLGVIKFVWKTKGKIKKRLQRDLIAKKKSPPAQPRAGCDYRQYLLYFSRGSDISFPRQTHDGCHALWLHWVCDDVISEKESKIGFSLRSFSCFGVFQTLPSFPFFSFKIHPEMFPNQTSLQEPFPPLFCRCPALAPGAGSLLGNG